MVDVLGSSRSVQHRDKDCHTHPTTVSHWWEFCEEVKKRLGQPDIMVSCFNSLKLHCINDSTAARVFSIRYDSIKLQVASCKLHASNEHDFCKCWSHHS